ncbi:MAG: GNAT family N-acetyltransferase [Gammaproteobacteria bacterium]|nr:GNAT family N-acetyltransferase [Gammaproteobacteria bacterium]NIR96929.1 GNAT family N-acetyltransferase [Gammaproteobacteria bacterium]NIT62631.1 GNAT family N-acetyltransferase [Gammaproteobacteria bacterium]NIV19591.1 GNAT family N-acetyltransferase [Gammaproteobacteria bacterium]NIX10811.1 GNAT family N-acetyltransferase [Gammaproteobacteria bacterium]
MDGDGAGSSWHIDHLGDHPGSIPQLAQWHHEEWSTLNPGGTVKQRIKSLSWHLAQGQIPATYVAVLEGAVVGSASLIERDMAAYIQLSPWLAGVYVAPAYRRRGIGSALVRRVADEAAGFGITTLYLFTPGRERFYRRLGWEVLERTVYRRHRVAVMALGLPGGAC